MDDAEPKRGSNLNPYLGAVVASWARIYFYEPRLVLVVDHEVVAVQLP